MIRFEDLERKVHQYHPSDDLELLRKAYVFSAREHKGQVRQSGEPYLSHPLEVANILAEMKLDVSCVSVGLLHDVVEDTLTRIEKIREYFGDDIGHVVDGLTKISKIHFSSREERQAENFRKLLLAMVDDVRVIMVKLADRLHNMRTLQYLSPEKREAIAQETLDIYAPIAHRLGMAKMRGELEDLSFSYLDPPAYQNLLGQIEEKKANSRQFIAEVTDVMLQRIQEQGIQVQIESRIKQIYSLRQKMMRQRITSDQVYDFIAIRILVDSVRDCYTILGLVNNLWKPVPGRIKDLIAMPRPNMYQSLHTSLVGPNGQPFEIQIRTHEMNRVAEEGIAAHWKYKEGRLEEEGEEKRFLWLRQLLDMQQEVEDPHHFLSNLKIDLFPEEVYVFTPKGEVVTLPRGVTPVDFAYYIHSEVGNRCVGAKVNSRIVPLKYELRNGEIVEILTSSEEHPSRDWMNFVKTSRARNSIRRWLNQRQKERAIEIGQKMLEKEARKCKLNLKKYKTELGSIALEYKAAKLEDLFASIGYGKIGPKQVLKRLDPGSVAKEESKESALSTVVQRVFGSSDAAIQVKGYDDLLVFRAKCCNPIQGEQITGYITVGRGISVHSTKCRNVENLLVNPERRIEVEWSDGVGEVMYPVRLSIATEDRTGILAEITASVSTLNTNIVDAHAKTVNSQFGEIRMTIEVRDMKHLQKIVGFLKGISGIHSIERRGRAHMR